MTRAKSGSKDDDGWMWIEQSAIPWDVDVIAEKVDGVIEITALRLLPKKGAKQSAVVTAEQLRRLPLRQIKRQAAHIVSGDGMAGLEPMVYAKRGQRLADEHYRDVALYYEHYLESKTSPRQGIAGFYGVPIGTAGRWIERARELGFLGRPSKPGMPGVDVKPATTQGPKLKAKVARKRR